MVMQPENRTLIATSELAHFAAIISRFLQSPATSGARNDVTLMRAGQGHEFLDFRDYQAGDDMRHIDWRASARSQRAKVRTYYQEAGSDCFLCLDQSTSMRLHSDKWQQTQKLVAALAYTYLFAGYRVALLCFSDGLRHYLPPGRGAAHFSRLVAKILEIPLTSVESSQGLKSCLPLLGTGEIFVLSDLFFSTSVEESLSALPHLMSSVHILHMTSAGDFRLPPDQACMLVDCETQQRLGLVSHAQVQQAAAQHQEMEAKRLQQYCRSQRLRYTQADDQKHWREVLLAHFKPGQPHALTR